MRIVFAGVARLVGAADSRRRRLRPTAAAAACASASAAAAAPASVVAGTAVAAAAAPRCGVVASQRTGAAGIAAARGAHAAGHAMYAARLATSGMRDAARAIAGTDCSMAVSAPLPRVAPRRQRAASLVAAAAAEAIRESKHGLVGTSAHEHTRSTGGQLQRVRLPWHSARARTAKPLGAGEARNPVEITAKRDSTAERHESYCKPNFQSPQCASILGGMARVGRGVPST